MKKIDIYNGSAYRTKINELDLVKMLLNDEYTYILCEYFDSSEGPACGVKDDEGKWLFRKIPTEHFKHNDRNNNYLFFTEKEQTLYLNILFKKIGWDFQYKENFINEGILRPLGKKWDEVLNI